MRLPPLNLIVDSIHTTEVRRSVSYLLRARSALSKYTCLEDFALRDEEYTTKTDEDPRTLQACEYHLIQVRKRIATELWARNFFLGITVLDELLFSAFAHTESATPILLALERIRDSGVLRPGFVVYPLHALGVVGGGALYSFTPSRVQFLVQKYGLVVTPQTNSFEQTISFLESAADTLGVRRKVPRDLLDHWRRSRPTKWLERNPLLVLRVHSFPGDYYENQFFLLCKLKLATTLLFMLNSMQSTPSDRSGLFLSSSRTNNWETLDLRHYLVFYPKPYKPTLEGDCVPMNVSQATLAELSEVPVQIDPAFWQQRTPISDRIIDALDMAGKGYIRYSHGKPTKGARGKVYQKIFRSLEFYRRSYRQRDDVGEASVNLAAAFEILLTDMYGKGVSNRILDRVTNLLSGTEDAKRLTESLERLYAARSQYVHAGTVDHSLDIEPPQVAFIYTFLALALRLKSIPTKAEEPMKVLIEGKRMKSGV